MPVPLKFDRWGNSKVKSQWHYLNCMEHQYYWLLLYYYIVSSYYHHEISWFGLKLFISKFLWFCRFNQMCTSEKQPMFSIHKFLTNHITCLPYQPHFVWQPFPKRMFSHNTCKWLMSGPLRDQKLFNHGSTSKYETQNSWTVAVPCYWKNLLFFFFEEKSYKVKRSATQPR